MPDPQPKGFFENMKETMQASMKPYQQLFSGDVKGAIESAKEMGKADKQFNQSLLRGNFDKESFDEIGEAYKNVLETAKEVLGNAPEKCDDSLPSPSAGGVQADKNQEQCR